MFSFGGGRCYDTAAQATWPRPLGPLVDSVVPSESFGLYAEKATVTTPLNFFPDDCKRKAARAQLRHYLESQCAQNNRSLYTKVAHY